MGNEYQLQDSGSEITMTFSSCLRGKRKLKSLILMKMVTVACYYILMHNREQHDQNSRQTMTNKQQTLKSILLWNNPMDRIEVTVFGSGHKAFIQQGCEFTECEIVNSQWQYPERPLSSYEAVIFLFNNHDPKWLVNQLPSFNDQWDYTRQRFVFFTQESPAYLKQLRPRLKQLNQKFNWIMSYRKDSDIKLLYGRVNPLKPLSNKNHRIDKMKRKKKLVAWMVSHCETHGRREDYVKELQRYIKVDIFGNCGRLKCAWNETHWISQPECYDMIESNYKFYLSFENSICPEYVTEKFFRILQLDLVPVVYGGADYSAIAPPHSYIDARQYTPKELSKYLKKLQRDDNLYAEYFHWKKSYVVEAGVEQMSRHAFCDLCKKLHQDQQMKIYENIHEFFNIDHCYRPIFNFSSIPWSR